MKTNTLLLTTALAVGVTSLIVPSAHSQGATNSINVTVPANGFALVGNPVDRGSNTLNEILPNAPVNTKVFDFDVEFRAIGTKLPPGWPPALASTVEFPPGKGFFLWNRASTNIVVTFDLSAVLAGTNAVSIRPGFNLLASPVPISGRLETDLGLPAVTGDKVFRFAPASQSFALYTRRATGWRPAEPQIGVAEGFFFVTTNTLRWTKTFNPPRP